MVPPPPTMGVILAGGLSRRMGGGDKPLLTIGERTLLQCVAERLTPQCETVILNANRNPTRFEGMNLPVVPDSIAGHPGPLAGILAALDWAATHHEALEWVVSVPGDTPFIPPDLVQQLQEARQKAGRPLACAASGGQVHFAVGLWPVSLRRDLRRVLVETDMRSIRDWAQLHGYAQASWPAVPLDPFFNVNRPDDLDHARALAQLEGFR